VPELRPRIAIPLPDEGRRAARLLRALAGELAEPPVDLVLVGPLERAEAAAREAGVVLPTEVVERPGLVGAALERARGAGRGVVLLAAAEEAAGLVARGTVDAVVDLADPPGPRLRIRGSARVVEPCPGLAAVELPGRLEAEAIAGAAASAVRLLAALGVARPRLVLCDVAGADAPAAAGRLARERGLDLVGPLRAGAAVRERGDALVALSDDQAELVLELRGAGPASALRLEAAAPTVHPLGAEPAGLAAAVSRAAELARGLGRELAAAREEARRPRLEARAPRPAEDRCPYCHRALREPLADLEGAPGPPVTCVACGTPHHRDCLGEHGRCTVMGCPGSEVLRLGVRLPIAGLAAEEPQLRRFEPLEGDAGGGPSWLRVERPIDDPTARPGTRTLRLEVPGPARRGQLVEGYLTLAAPRPHWIRGATLRLRTALTTRQLRSGAPPPQTHAIVDRRAPFVGERPATAIGRLQDGVVAWFGSARSGVEVPAGLRRYPFAFRLPVEHPATICNRSGGAEESVATTLEVTCDTLAAAVALEVA